MTHSVITLVIILQFSIPQKYNTSTDVECLWMAAHYLKGTFLA